MRITYTEHAEARMDFRKISKTEVEEAISHPNLTALSRLGRTIAAKKKGDKYLKVIYDKSNDKITVVTVYWTRRP
jgi:hypothetical protein